MATTKANSHYKLKCFTTADGTIRSWVMWAKEFEEMQISKQAAFKKMSFFMYHGYVREKIDYGECS
jgi:hypothetical protein